MSVGGALREVFARLGIQIRCYGALSVTINNVEDDGEHLVLDGEAVVVVGED